MIEKKIKKAVYLITILVIGVLVAIVFNNAALADEEKDLDKAIVIMEQVVENAKNGIFLTDISKQCPIDAQPPSPDYKYSDNPETQKWCMENSCHCL